jgi:rhodanese-related sulfurtransferase
MNAPAIRTITSRELHELSLRQPINLVDVRTPQEFQLVHAVGARNVPLDSQDLFDLLQVSGGENDQTIYFICEVGGRSGRACATFMELGRPNVVNVEDGTRGWIEAGLPIV